MQSPESTIAAVEALARSAAWQPCAPFRLPSSVCAAPALALVSPGYVQCDEFASASLASDRQQVTRRSALHPFASSRLLEFYLSGLSGRRKDSIWRVRSHASRHDAWARFALGLARCLVDCPAATLVRATQPAGCRVPATRLWPLPASDFE